MPRYKLIISYDGTDYSGWQIQPNAPSIQQHLQDAIDKCSGGKPHTVIGSGRTDAGVHALAQVAHFDSEAAHETSRLQLMLNGILPRDIRVKHVEEVSKQFHAQRSALGKEYHYHLHLDRVADPFRRLYCWHLFKKVDLALLHEAASLFVGTHDFTSFTNEPHSGSAARNPVRTLFRLDPVPIAGGLRLEFEGNGFLYKMVRNIVGSLIDVASSKCPLEELSEIFKAKDRRRAGRAAPPQGLFLVNVTYPQSDQRRG